MAMAVERPRDREEVREREGEVGRGDRRGVKKAVNVEDQEKRRRRRRRDGDDNKAVGAGSWDSAALHRPRPGAFDGREEVRGQEEGEEEGISPRVLCNIK